MSANRLFIAAAGSGKTKLIIDEVINNKESKILITTFTLANEKSIREKLIKANGGCIPPNINIQTWFSFLLEHGIRPYRFWEERITGMQLVSTASGFRYNLKNGTPVYWGEKDFMKYYFNANLAVYSDKLAKLVYSCNKESKGYVIKRLEQIYDHIYIDEVQDMAGWDLELIKLFLGSVINLTMVGDPRQTVYLTHHDRKYSKYNYGKIKEFINNECKKVSCSIDETTLANSHRNFADICDLSSRLCHDMPECLSCLKETHSHMGIFFVPEREATAYQAQFNAMQLCLNKATEVCEEAPRMNFGESKGLEYPHVLIYPTGDMMKWLCGQKISLKDKTKAQLYVALTRAFFSVGIVVKNDFSKMVTDISTWKSSSA